MLRLVSFVDENNYITSTRMQSAQFYKLEYQGVESSFYFVNPLPKYFSRYLNNSYPFLSHQ